MRQAPKSDIYLETRMELEDRMCTMLAGAVAEELILGERSTGASQDIEQAVETARKIVNCGLSDLGIISEEDIPRDKYHDAIWHLVRAQEDRTRSLLSEHSELIREIAGELMDVERIDGDAFRRRLAVAV